MYRLLIRLKNLKMVHAARLNRTGTLSKPVTQFKIGALLAFHAAHINADCLPSGGNMFGDIITDLGAMIQGGMGIAAGGNINPEGVSMFEPIGGSAPKYTGMNVINPIAAIASAQLMLDELGEKEAADSIEEAIKWAVSEKLESLAARKMGYSTSEVGDMLADRVG